ncbi:MAG: T9SS type A sorting domain-containing protein, partial [Candidatus Cloacimonetes bacterium]|nr:T9SS type A sorting domain-containing protein [Candidatus Cloacimonadota bacterium]
KAIHHPKGFVSGSVSLDYNPQLVSQVKISASTHPDIYVYPDQYGQYTLPLYQGNYAFIKAELDNFMPAVITAVAVVSNQTTDVPITMNYLRRPVAISYQIESNLLQLNWNLEPLNNSALPTKVGTRFSSKLRLTPVYYKIWIMHNQQTVVDTTGAQAYQTLLESGSYELYIKSVYLAYDGTEVYSAQSETLSFINTSAPELPQPPIVFGLEQNYPNPFTNSTIIRYSLSKTSETSLSVYNIKGELVRTLVKSEQKSGKYQIEFNGLDNKSRALPSGVYFYRLAAGRQTITHKLVILK